MPKEVKCRADCACQSAADGTDHRILVEVSGGLVQEVYVTPGLKATIFRVDWDGIKEGDVSDPPWVEWDPVELTHEEFKAKLKEVEGEHEDRRRCYRCNAPLIEDGKIIHSESGCSGKPEGRDG